MSDWNESHAARRLQRARQLAVDAPPPLSAVRQTATARARRAGRALAFALALPVGAMAAIGGYTLVKKSPPPEAPMLRQPARGFHAPTRNVQPETVAAQVPGEMRRAEGAAAVPRVSTDLPHETGRLEPAPVARVPTDSPHATAHLEPAAAVARVAADSPRETAHLEPAAAVARVAIDSPRETAPLEAAQARATIALPSAPAVVATTGGSFSLVAPNARRDDARAVAAVATAAQPMHPPSSAPPVREPVAPGDADLALPTPPAVVAATGGSTGTTAGSVGAAGAAPTATPTAAAAPAHTPLAEESALLSEALAGLRARHEPQRALGVLETYRLRFPEGVLRREAALATVEAHRALGHTAQALAALEGLSGRAELDVLRAELDAELGNCDAARLAVRGLNLEGALRERALFTDATCALAKGARSEAIADLEQLPDSARARALLLRLQ